MAKFRIQPHMRLQEWVADELGLFREEGLEYEFQVTGFASGSDHIDLLVVAHACLG